MTDIRMPDGAVVRFPDHFTGQQIRDLIAHKFPRAVGEATLAAGKTADPAGHPEYAVDAEQPYSETYFAQGTSGLNEGIANTLGAPVDIVNSALGLGMKGVNAVAGTDFQPSDRPMLGSAQIKEFMGGAIQPKSDDIGKQMLRRTSESVGGAIIPGGAAMRSAEAPLKLATGLAGSTLAGGSAAAATQQLLPDNPTAEMIAELVGSIGTGGATAALRTAQAKKVARANVPTVEKLFEQGDAQYKAAEANGITATRPQTYKLHGKMLDIATKEGLISPTGRVSEAYPKAREALRMMEDYSKGTMNVPQMKAVRKTLGDAAQSADKSERRIASMMLKQFDNFTSPLAPQLQRGNQLWHAASKGATLEQMKELAHAGANKYSQSGMENALRTEYRGLNKKIIKGQENGWTDAEKAAIAKVSDGTPTANLARGVGKMAPMGPMSFTAGAGLPALIGTYVGGPWLGGAAAATMAGTGYAAKGLATKMGLNAADDAETLVRGMGKMPQADLDDVRRFIAALMATTAANQANPQSR